MHKKLQRKAFEDPEKNIDRNCVGFQAVLSTLIRRTSDVAPKMVSSSAERNAHIVTSWVITCQNVLREMMNEVNNKFSKIN